MDAASKPTRGRPTRESAAARHRELLDRAMEMFLERGYENTTISDVAAAAGMTRRTVYARYAEKRELFRATLENGADRMIVATADLDAVDTADLRAALTAFCRLRVTTTLTPLGIQMQRFVHAEAHRFPELTREIYARISRPTSERIVALLESANARGETAVGNPDWAAQSLMSMVVGAPLTMALITGIVGMIDMDEHVRLSVDLFLDGVRRRD